MRKIFFKYHYICFWLGKTTQECELVSGLIFADSRMTISDLSLMYAWFVYYAKELEEIYKRGYYFIRPYHNVEYDYLYM